MMKETDTTTTTTILRPRPKSGRKPLQPRNDNNIITTSKSQVPTLKPKPDHWNKENLISKMNHLKIINIEPFEASLADELTAIRKKMERLKLDKDNTDNLLKERDLMIDMQMNQLQLRGEAQKHLEIQKLCIDDTESDKDGAHGN
ncbi:hypothetical protein Leryth_011591 [Lithospermum erythrorhizon]|nr:hypothetical protein Leryth_011591 [Lithospermum erythrorhizon]